MLNEKGSAPAAMMMLLGATVSLFLVVVVGAHVLITLTSTQNSTDRAALAAADAASGRIAGYPCELAQEIADISGVALTSCNIEGLVSRVTMKVSIYGFQIQTRSQAGPKSMIQH